MAAAEARRAKEFGDGTLKRDLELLADEGLDLYQQATALKLRADVELRSSQPST